MKSLSVLGRFAQIALGFTLASCGTGRVETPQAKTTITIARSMSPINMLLEIAEEEKLWGQEAIEAHDQVFPSARQAMDAIVSNSSDLATAADTPLMIALHRKTGLKLLCTLASSDRHIAVVSKPVVTREDCAGFEGKRVALSIGTTQQYFFYRFLGRDPAACDVKIVNLAPTDALTAFFGGQEVDAIVAWEPQLSKASQAAGAAVDYGNGLRQVFGLAFGTKSRAVDPALRDRIKKVLSKASQWAEAHPESARDLLEKSQQVSPVTASELQKSYKFDISDEDEMIGGMAAQEQWAKDKGYIQEAFGLDGLRYRVEP